MKKIINRILSVLLVLTWMLVIFYFSNMDSVESNDKSKDVIKEVVYNINIITNNDVSLKQQESLVNVLNKPLRKIMHLLFYLILSVLLINVLKFNKIKSCYFFTLLICFLYAITDEYHQLLVMGRTGSFCDVLIDFIGSVFGVVIYNFGNKYFTFKKNIFNN